MEECKTLPSMDHLEWSPWSVGSTAPRIASASATMESKPQGLNHKFSTLIPCRQYVVQLNLTVCSQCTTVPVHTRRVDMTECVKVLRAKQSKAEQSTAKQSKAKQSKAWTNHRLGRLARSSEPMIGPCFALLCLALLVTLLRSLS